MIQHQVLPAVKVIVAGDYRCVAVFGPGDARWAGLLGESMPPLELDDADAGGPVVVPAPAGRQRKRKVVRPQRPGHGRHFIALDRALVKGERYVYLLRPAVPPGNQAARPGEGHYDIAADMPRLYGTLGWAPASCLQLHACTHVRTTRAVDRHTREEVLQPASLVVRCYHVNAVTGEVYA